MRLFPCRGPLNLGYPWDARCFLIHSCVEAKQGHVRPVKGWLIPFNFLTSTSPPIYAFWSSHSSVVDLEAHPSVLSWNRWLYGIVVYECTSKVVGFLKPSVSPHVNEFINLSKLFLSLFFELMYVFLKKWNFFLKQLTEKKNNRFTKPRRRIVLLQVFWQRAHTLGFLWNWNEDLRYSHESQFCFEFQCSKVCCSNCYLRFKVQMIILHIRSRSYCLLFFGFVCNTNPFSNYWYKAYFYIILK